jgi:hypothetical protein
MLEAVPLLATTLAFISIFAYSYAQLELEEIKANWNKRRCEPLVMVMAALVQIDPKKDPTAMAIENFEFCIGKIIDSSIAIFLAPMLQLFTFQMDATKPITDSMNYLRAMAGSLLKPLNDLFNTLWAKLMVVVYQSARIFFQLYSSMDRVFGIATASVFAGMSMYKGIQNAMGFVIQVIIAILIILCVLVVFLFFVMWPVIPLILTMIGILSTTVYAANVSGMSGSFCVAPWTMVKTKMGYKRVSELVPGEELDDGVIEGILKVEGGADACVRIDGIIISKTHLIKYEGKWIMAGEHPAAETISNIHVGLLYCLNTSTRQWTVKGTDTDHNLRDWEELPDSKESDAAWEEFIYSLLNKGSIKHSAPGRGLFGEATIIYTLDSEKPISKVVIGDYIRDKVGYTRVIGIYKDTELVPRSGPNKAVWALHPQARECRAYSKGWTHLKVEECLPMTKNAYQLVTDSGTFIIQSNILVRDFTEVGADRIHETYSFTQSRINIASF